MVMTKRKEKRKRIRVKKEEVNLYLSLSCAPVSFVSNLRLPRMPIYYFFLTWVFDLENPTPPSLSICARNA